MNEIDYETLDVTSIMILIGHDHNVTISQCFNICFIVFCLIFETNDIDDILQLFICKDLFRGCIADVERLSFEWKYTIVISTNNRKTGPVKDKFYEKLEIYCVKSIFTSRLLTWLDSLHYLLLSELGYSPYSLAPLQS